MVQEANDLFYTLSYQAMERHQVVRSVIEKAGSRMVSVTFYKKDGTKRKLTFNPKDRQGIKGTGHSTAKPNIFRVREIGKDQWRSFDSDRLLTLRANSQLLTFPE